MNKKGFTLAEILGVIVIIALLLLLLMPTIINKIAQNGDKAGEINDQLIFDAVDNYIEENIDTTKAGTYCIPIQDLVDDGKLVSPVIDVETGEDITDMTIAVTVDSDGNITHQIVEKDECNADSNIHKIDFIVNPDNNNWVHERHVIIKFPQMGSGYTYQYKIDNGNWQNAEEGNFELPVFTKISTLQARVTGASIITGSIDIINIDNELPVINSVTVEQNSKIKVNAIDNVSGIIGYYISENNVKPDPDASGWVTTNIKAGQAGNITISKNQGTYYIWVKDKAGNISAQNSEGGGTSITIQNRQVTATFIKGENIASIGSNSKTCTIEAGNNSCQITLPSITPNEGYILDGWYNGNTKVGNPNATYTLTNDVTLTSKVNADYASLTVSTTATSNTITAIANAEASSNIVKYEFSKDGGRTWEESDSNIYTFKNLTQGTTYQIYAKITTATGKTVEANREETTSSIIAPTFTQSGVYPITVKITFPEGCGTTYTCTYQKNNGEIKTVTTKEDNATFYLEDVDNKYNGSVLARVTDGTNEANNTHNLKIKLRAIDLSYNNDKTELPCEDAQCALDKLKEMLKN